MELKRILFHFILLIGLPVSLFAEFDSQRPYVPYLVGNSKFFLQAGNLYVTDDVAKAEASPRLIAEDIRVFNPPFYISNDRLYFMKTSPEGGKSQQIEFRARSTDSSRVEWVNSAGFVKFHFNKKKIILARVHLSQDGKVEVRYPRLNLPFNNFIIGTYVLREANHLNEGESALGLNFYAVDTETKKLSDPVFARLFSTTDLILTPERELLQFDPVRNKLVAVLGAPGMNIDRVVGSTIKTYTGDVYHIIRTKDGHYVAGRVDLGAEEQRAEEIFELAGETYILTEAAFRAVNGELLPTVFDRPAILRVIKPYKIENKKLLTEPVDWIKAGELGNLNRFELDRRDNHFNQFFFSPASCGEMIKELRNSTAPNPPFGEAK
ncbi:MAG: hypothetical protein JWQ35_635 [Bacteriovoracaceae bacterium]|nr:hypothetical protein [Bacteriovoracaceae bacterium]